jgi:hypothetical protein
VSTAVYSSSPRTSAQPHHIMRVVIFTVGTRGDVQPLLALALVLGRAGHRVTLCANDNFRGWVEQHGVRFAGAGCGKFDQSGWHEARSLGAFIELMARQSGELYQTMGSAFYRCAQQTLLLPSASSGGGSGGGGSSQRSRGRDSTVGSQQEQQPPALADTRLVLCTVFTQTLGLDIAEKLGAACAVLKWAPDGL